MFLLGLYAGRKLMYAKLDENIKLFKKLRQWGFIIGIPLSVSYALSFFSLGHIPDTEGLIITSLYAFSVIPLSLAYTAYICIWFMKKPHNKFLNAFAAPGRMALSNYVLQTITGIIIFYGTGFKLGAVTGASVVYCIAIGVYIFEMFFSRFWLSYFNYGPLEWIWRMLTYGKYLPIKKTQ